MPPHMEQVIGAFILALGVILLGSATVALLRGRIWINPRRLKPERRWRPGRWVTRDADAFEFWLGVVLYTCVGAAMLVTAANWLRR